MGIIRLERVSKREKLAANAKLKAELDALKLLKIEHDAHCEPLADLFSSGQMTAAKYNAMTAAQTKAYHQYNQSFGSYMDGSVMRFRNILRLFRKYEPGGTLSEIVERICKKTMVDDVAAPIIGDLHKEYYDCPEGVRRDVIRLKYSLLLFYSLAVHFILEQIDKLSE